LVLHLLPAKQETLDMATTEAHPQMRTHAVDGDVKQPRLREQSAFLARLTEAVLQIPPFIQVCCSSDTGRSAHGFLKAISHGGIQVVLPVSLPLGETVEITIATCRMVLGEVVYCVPHSGAYRVGMVFKSRHKPDLSVGCLVAVKALDEPFTVTRGSVLDVASAGISILCKTMLTAGVWVRVEANGSILFGLVQAVVATSMLACCVDIQLKAAFPAASAPASQIAVGGRETTSCLQPNILDQAFECNEAEELEMELGIDERQDCFVCSQGGSR
jgi:hypothetical protein